MLRFDRQLARVIVVALGQILRLSLQNKDDVAQLKKKVDKLMTLVTVDDSVIALAGTQLTAILDGVTKIVADESNPLQAADFTPITDPIAKLQAALASPNTPVDSNPPVDGGDTPPVDTTPPADSTPPADDGSTTV